jgi:hypothetical protein
MKVNLRGPFRIFDDAGQDRTPKGIKERALLALVLLAPGQRRTRASLQDKLWSESDADLASGSCRQALANVRKALGPMSSRVCSNRTAVWLDPAVPVDPDADSDVAELLDDLDVRDPEFDDWLRDLRLRHQTSQIASPPAFEISQRNKRPFVVIRNTGLQGTDRAAFLLRALAQRLEGELVLIGNVDVLLAERLGDADPNEPSSAQIEIESLDEEDRWFVLMRVYSHPIRRCVWTGRLQLPMNLGAIWDAPEMTRLVNQATSAVADLVAAQGNLTPFAAVQRAVRRVYDFDKVGLESADDLLQRAQDSDLAGLALAWRGFVRLTSALEFRQADRAIGDEAVEFCNEAIARAGNHPVVLALASQVHLKIKGDSDFGHYLALRAAEASDRNPYALDALSQAMFFRGEFQKSHDTALAGRNNAEGMANSFNWDMQCSLSALSLGQMDVAFSNALSCHRKMPMYRPALRYLIAFSLLRGQVTDAQHYLTRLQRLEPDFEMRMLLAQGYPVETLRLLGLVEQLRPIII